MTCRVIFYIYATFLLWVLFFVDQVSIKSPACWWVTSIGTLVNIFTLMFLDDTEGLDQFPIGTSLMLLMGCLFILKGYFSGETL